MNSKLPRIGATVATLALAGCSPAPAQTSLPGPDRPNIIFVLADDLGYGDIGVFFQNARRNAADRSRPWHITPQLDAMAAQGLQLPQHYCASSVCAPSRASFLTGVHQGHASVRDNQFDRALGNNYTVAGVLKEAGYATACIGKWGLQGKPAVDAPHKWPAHPQNRGFDSYFGYINHGAGHAHYPKEDGKPLIDGDKDVAADYDGAYTTDLFTARAKKWISDQRMNAPEQPFFLYLALDTPHAKLQYPPGPFPAGGGLNGGVQWLGKPGQMINTANGVPDSYCHPDYANATWDDDNNPATPEKPWPEVYKRYATSVRRIDDCTGDLLKLLKDLKIDDNTLVVFTSDNGPSQESYLPEKFLPTFFGSSGPFDGLKRDLWEGGIRVGAIARWPQQINAGRVSKTPSAFWDWLPTFAEAAGVPAPARTDGVSLLPTFQGKATQKPSKLYFEYFQNGRTPPHPEYAVSHRGRQRQQMQALRIGDFIGVRYDILDHDDPFEIYDVVKDPQQTKDLGREPEFAALQQQLHDAVLQSRRPLPSTPRPYDEELIPAIQPASSQKGLKWQALQNNTPWLAQPDTLQLLKTGVTLNAGRDIKLPGAANQVIFSGFIEAPEDGEYTFALAPDIKALLRIHDAIVLDADFTRQPENETTGVIRLKAGKHPLRFYSSLSKGTAPQPALKWGHAGAPLQAIPNSVYSH